MHDGRAGAVFGEAVLQLRHAADIAGGDDVGTGGGDVFQLARLEGAGQLGLENVCLLYTSRCV